MKEIELICLTIALESMHQNINSWQPKSFVWFIKSVTSSTRVAQIMTDIGEGYIKTLGNPEGPQAIAREYIGTAIAKWLGLRTFDFAVMEIEDADEINLGNSQFALPGPAFITRAERGRKWSGDKKDLKFVENQEMITKLIVLDTLILNWDRYPPFDMNRNPNTNNVFFSEEQAPKNKFLLTAMDHTHCLCTGSDLGRKLATVDNVKDEKVYGAFPAFHPYIRGRELNEMRQRLAQVKLPVVRHILREVPREWQVSDSAREEISQFLVDRARFLADNLQQMLMPLAPEQLTLDL